MNNPHIISYSSPSHEHYQRRLAKFLTECGYSHTEYIEKWLTELDEYDEMKDIFEQKRGAGYWAWKPLVLLDALQENEWVIYLDSDGIFDNYPGIFDKFYNHDLAAVDTGFNHGQWTKRDCFIIMDCNSEKYWNANQVWGGVVSARQRGLNYIWEWAQYCSDHRCITDSPSCAENLPNFHEHRHDQSILTNLIIKHNLGRVSTSDFRAIK